VSDPDIRNQDVRGSVVTIPIRTTQAHYRSEWISLTRWLHA
jgi:hypothetical protein